MHHQGHVHTALVGVLLVPLEGAVAALGPAPRVVGVRVGSADVIEAVHDVVWVVDDAVEVLHLVHDPERPALLGGAVVGQHDQDRVVELAHLAQPVDEPADLIVGVVQERGEGFLQAAGEAAMAVGQLCPRLHAGVAGRELGAFRYDALRELALVPPLTHHVPAFVEAPAVLVEVCLRSLVRSMGRPEWQVGEERPVGSHALAVVDHAQQLIHQVFAEVVALIGPAGRVDVVVVDHQLGVELVGLAFEESVEPVEAAAERPLFEWSGCGDVLGRGQVPLPAAEGGVTLLAEDFGEGCCVIGDVAELVREARAVVRHRAHADCVLGPSGQQRCPGRRAQRGDMEVRELQAACGERVDVGRVDVRAVAAELGKTGVVEQHDHNVGCIGTRMRRRGEVRLGLGQRAADAAFEWGGLDRMCHRGS